MEDLFGRGGGMVFEFLRLARTVKRELGNIRQNAIIFHPREDDQSDLSNTLLLQRRLGGMVETTVLDDCYHMVTLDKQRNFVVDRTVDFARRLCQQLEDKAAASRWKERRVEPSEPKHVAGGEGNAS